MTKIVFKDGTTYIGSGFGIQKEVMGELIVETSMTGYQAIMNDPRYAENIILFTYPLIGNYGFHSIEKDNPRLAAMVVREVCERPSNVNCDYDLLSYCDHKNIAGLQGVDTRSIARKVRKEGVQTVIVCDDSLPTDIAIERLTEYEAKEKLAQPVSVKKPVIYKGTAEKVVVVDYGASQEIVDKLVSRHCQVAVLPYDVTAADILSYSPDGVIVSDGVGNPNDFATQAKKFKDLFSKTSILGINFGSLILGLAEGLPIEKLSFGHHGQNYPIKNKITGKVEITTQNKMYTVKSVDNSDFRISHINVNDHHIEGIQHKDYDVSGLSYFNEAVMDDFIARMGGN